MARHTEPRMSPAAQVRLGKILQLMAIFAMLAALFGVVTVSADFVKGVDFEGLGPGMYALILIYGMGLSHLGTSQVKKGRTRQAEAKKAEEEIAKRAAAAAAVEQGPELCRTGGEHIYIGDDTACFNGCGTNRDQAKVQA